MGPDSSRGTRSSSKRKSSFKSDPGPSKPIPGLETGPTTCGHIRPGVNVLTISFDLQEPPPGGESQGIVIRDSETRILSVKILDPSSDDSHRFLTNHESRITNHESRITNHESRITNHDRCLLQFPPSLHLPHDLHTIISNSHELVVQDHGAVAVAGDEFHLIADFQLLGVAREIQ